MEVHPTGSADKLDVWLWEKEETNFFFFCLIKKQDDSGIHRDGRNPEEDVLWLGMGDKNSVLNTSSLGFYSATFRKLIGGKR